VNQIPPLYGFRFILASGGDQNAAITATQIDDRLARFHLGDIQHQLYDAHGRRHVRSELVRKARILGERRKRN
jgi:hypothetical protein